MIDTCDPEIASWTEDGDRFVVKSPDTFAKKFIPQYFDHNKFSSFARQLNFYGFRKIAMKPVRNDDFTKETSKHVTFFNDKFKRGRVDLLSEIQRSTRVNATNINSYQEQQREIQMLKGKVESLERQMKAVSVSFDEQIHHIRTHMMQLMEQFMYSMQQAQTYKSQQMNVNQIEHSIPANEFSGKVQYDTSNLQFDMHMPSEISSNEKGRTYPQIKLQPYVETPPIPIQCNSYSGGLQPLNNITSIGPNIKNRAHIPNRMDSIDAYSKIATLPPHPKHQLIPQTHLLPPSLPQPDGDIGEESPLRGISTLSGISNLDGLRGLSGSFEALLTGLSDGPSNNYVKAVTKIENNEESPCSTSNNDFVNLATHDKKLPTMMNLKCKSPSVELL